ncbi:MAG: hypothetical protein PHP30_02955 [Bacteroidales bacterium]|nr:hypothetical protein [Bacteroidales bacterium]MDD2425186.1 hypothetical protein [Bacteroidales bacterium]MDD3989040.1 hypothetical protein [Bacteroidales bacterium]
MSSKEKRIKCGKAAGISVFGNLSPVFSVDRISQLSLGLAQLVVCGIISSVIISIVIISPV